MEPCPIIPRKKGHPGGEYPGVSCWWIFVSLDLPHLYTVLLIAGFCGALSTWSTLAKELGQLLNEKKWWPMLGYLSLTFTLGYSAVFLGMRL